MKKLLTLLTVASLTQAIYSQEDMPVVWEMELSHKINYTGTGTEEGGFSYAASDKEMTVFSNKDGKVVWTKAYKDLAGKLGKVDELIPFWESNTVFLFDRKVGKDQIACIDLESGDLLWHTEKYQNIGEDNVVYIKEEDAFVLSLKEEMVFIKARTGEEKWSTSKFKGVVGQYVWRDGKMVAVNFQPSGLAALFTGFKNQIAKINLTNGEIEWEQTYVGRAERKVITKQFLFSLDLEGDIVTLLMNGLQTYDFNTGAKLWAAAFDFTPDKVVRRPVGDVQVFGVYGAVAEPLFVGDDVYVLDMQNIKKQFIKKYDRNTGKLLWTSGEIKGAKAIPAMGIAGDKIILQIGGNVEVQYRIRKKEGDQWVTETFVGYQDVKPWGLQAFNTTDGSVAWISEKFKKGITNSFTSGENVIVSSGKILYSMKSATGEVNYEKVLKDGNISRGEMLVDYGDKTIVIGNNGISSYNTADGNLICSTKFKKSTLEEDEEDYLIMRSAGRRFASFNKKDCTYKESKAKKDAVTSLSIDGRYVYVYEGGMLGKTVTKLSTK